MQSRLVRVVDDEAESGWGDWAASLAHKNFKYSVLGLIKPSAVPSAEKIKEVGGVAYDAAEKLVNMLCKSKGSEIENIPLSKSVILKDVDGHVLEKGSVYAGHPLNGSLMKASALHSFILKEQRAQIIRYFRSAVALKSLTIEIISQNSGEFYMGGGWKAINGKAEKEEKVEQRHWFAVSYSDPQKESEGEARDLFWMPYFDELVAATQDSRGGSIETTTSLNTAFGISAEAAKIANINSNWISQQSFLVKAEYI